MSEDEDSKTRKKNDKKKKEGAGELTEEELNAPVHIILEETETETLMFIPSTIDLEENQENIEQTKAYEELLESKIGSDSYANKLA